MNTSQIAASDMSRPETTRNPPRIGLHAFARFELLAVACGLFLLSSVLLPALARYTSLSDRLVCLNNLRNIGLGLQIWGADKDQMVPWQYPIELGGTRPTDPGGYNKLGQVWYEMAWISNELGSPKFLACPSDALVQRVATEFTQDPERGLLHSNFRNNAVSYLLGLHGYGHRDRTLIGADRNLWTNSRYGECSSHIRNALNLPVPVPDNWITWTNGLHGTVGNVLLDDGSVFTTSEREMIEVWRAQLSDGAIHVLMPR